MRFLSVWLVLVVSCAGDRAYPAKQVPEGAMDVLPAGPITVMSATEGAVTGTAGEWGHAITFRDSRGGIRTLTLRYTSYPIVVTGVTLDGKDVARSASWDRLSKRLIDAGLSNNATLLLRTSGSDSTQ